MHKMLRTPSFEVPTWRHALIVALIVAAAVPTFLAARAITVRGQGAGPTTDASFTEIGGTKPPALSAAEGAEAEALARGHEAVAALTRKSTGRVTTIAWYGFDQKLIGAVVEFDLDSVASGAFTFPIADYHKELEKTSRRPYVSATIDVDVTSIKGFYVKVNLRTKEVASIIPKDGSQLTLRAPRPDLEKKVGSGE